MKNLENEELEMQNKIYQKYIGIVCYQSSVPMLRGTPIELTARRPQKQHSSPT